MRTKASDIRSIVRRVMMMVMVVWGSKGQRRASYVIPVIWASSAMSKARAHELSLSYPSILSNEGISYFVTITSQSLHVYLRTCVSLTCQQFRQVPHRNVQVRAAICPEATAHAKILIMKKSTGKHNTLTPQQRRTGILMAISRSVPITQSKSQSKKQTSVPCFADNSMLVS
jgi:hypothetical protein